MKKATVKISLTDGETTEELELIPTLAAMEYLNSKTDNFQAIFAKLASMNFETYAQVVYAGVIGKKPDFAAIKENVYETGIIPLMEPLIRYVSILLNGGKEPSKEPEKETGSGE